MIFGRFRHQVVYKSVFYMKILFQILSLIFLFYSCFPKPTDSSIEEDAVEIEEATIDKDDLSGEDELVGCRCAVSAYLDDPDESGTNVRETPRGKIMGKLQYEEDCLCRVVNFIESKDGWMLLEEGGWVFGKLFSIDTRNYAPGEKVALREYPTEGSRILAEFDREMTFQVKDCCGEWLMVVDKEGNSGWLEKEMICANPLTNCS
jgi:hypothetical protein